MTGLVQVGSQAMADRYVYLPAVGVAIAVVWTLAEGVADRRAARLALASAAAAVLLALGLASRVQLAHWRDSFALFEHALRVTRGNAIAHAKLGDALLAEGRRSEAIGRYREALRLIPGYLETQNNLAWLLATHPDPRQRRPAEAVRLAEAAARRRAEDPVVLDTLAAAYACAGRYHRAVRIATQALGMARATGDPALVEALHRRLRTYREGRPYVE